MPVEHLVQVWIATYSRVAASKGHDYARQRANEAVEDLKHAFDTNKFGPWQ